MPTWLLDLSSKPFRTHIVTCSIEAIKRWILNLKLDRRISYNILALLALVRWHCIGIAEAVIPNNSGIQIQCQKEMLQMAAKLDRRVSSS